MRKLHQCPINFPSFAFSQSPGFKITSPTHTYTYKTLWENRRVNYCSGVMWKTTSGMGYIAINLNMNSKGDIWACWIFFLMVKRKGIISETLGGETWDVVYSFSIFNPTNCTSPQQYKLALPSWRHSPSNMFFSEMKALVPGRGCCWGHVPGPLC